MTSGNVRSFTKANFTSDVLNSPLPVMLHFYATWAEPCKQLTPIINSLADKYAEQIVFGNVDVDRDEELALEYGVTSVPTIFLIVDGAVKHQLTGYKDRQFLDIFCNQNLSK